MTRPIRLLIGLGLLALVYWQYAAFVDDSPVPPRGEEDWREGAGLIVVFAALACYFALSYVGAMKQIRPISASDAQAEIVFSASTVQIVLLAVPLISGAAGAYLLFSAQLSSPMSLILAYGGAVLAFLAGFLMLVHFTCGPFRLSLSESGLDYAPFKCGPIAWHDIRSVDVNKYFSSEIISLNLADPEKYFARGFPKSGRNMGRFGKAFSSPFAIYARQLQASTDAILSAINARLDTCGRTPNVKETP